MRIALIKPILNKKGLDKNNLNNYRPISQLPVFSKLLERVVSQQIIKHIERHSLLHPNQSAYVPHKSTKTVLTRINNDILVNNSVTIIIFLAMSAAFDTLNHRTLINHLVNIGFRDDALIGSNHTLRTEVVSIGNMKSKNILLVYVIPQGSVLGPIIFNIYLFEIIYFFPHISFHSYTDDIQIFFPASNPNDIYSCSRLR